MSPLQKNLPSLILAVSLTIAAAAMAAAQPSPLTSSAVEQTGVAVTIYNSGIGLVRERRELRLPLGQSELRFMDVAEQVIPASVHITSLSAPDSLRILEQNYEYDLLSPQKLMDKYVGKEVRLYEKNPFSEREEIVSAILVSNNVTPIYRIGSDITFNHPGRVTLPGVPENLIPKPTLVWLLENDMEKTQQVETSYLTGGISWQADYVLTLDKGDGKGELGGWVTIGNRSGATYRNATLKLVAGEVNRVREEQLQTDRGVRMAATAAAKPQFREQELFEYHLYTLERPTTLKDNQSKQISLLSASLLPLKKEFVLAGQNFYYYGPQADPGGKQKVSVFVEFANRKGDGLGIPLPKGTIRVYKEDGDGSLQFIGEDSIPHTPRDEKVRVRLGEAFDVVGTRKQTDWKKIASDSYEAAFEITLSNHKSEEVTVRVIEPIPGEWKILSTSHEYIKNEAFAAEFQLPVRGDGETKLNYRARMRY